MILTFLRKSSYGLVFTFQLKSLQIPNLHTRCPLDLISIYAFALNWNMLVYTKGKELHMHYVF